MKRIFRIIEFLYYALQHKYSGPYPAFQPANESYPVIRCMKCNEEFENCELDFCPKWYKRIEKDQEIKPEDLPF